MSYNWGLPRWAILSIPVILFFFMGCASAPIEKIDGGTRTVLEKKSAYNLELIKLDTRPGVSQNFLLYTPEKPKACVMLFPGGDGRLALTDSGWIRENRNNLVVRIKEDLVRAGFMVALVDAPTDKLGQHGMFVGSFRCTTTHYGDMRKVIEYLKARKNIPVWLFGFSIGNHSTTFLAGLFKKEINGMIIASSVTNWSVLNPKTLRGYPDGILSMNLDQIFVPVLIVHHENDRCKLCPPSRIPKIKKGLKNSPRVEIKYISGGQTHSNPCGPLGHHGYRGKEKDALNAIVDFIKSSP